MPRKRRAKKADFKLRKRLSRPRGLAWGPHPRQPSHAKEESQDQRTRKVARWHHVVWHDRATLVSSATKLFRRSYN